MYGNMYAVLSRQRKKIKNTALTYFFFTQALFNAGESLLTHAPNFQRILWNSILSVHLRKRWRNQVHGQQIVFWSNDSNGSFQVLPLFLSALVKNLMTVCATLYRSYRSIAEGPTTSSHSCCLQSCSGKDVFVFLPIGFGKSICSFRPQVCGGQKRCVVVVSRLSAYTCSGEVGRKVNVKFITRHHNYAKYWLAVFECWHMHQQWIPGSLSLPRIN